MLCWRLGGLIVYFVLVAVGGYESVGKYRLGFGEEMFGFFETGADMREEQLFGVGFQRKGGGLGCGAGNRETGGRANEH